MRAAVLRRYGPPEVLRIAEVARPEPREDEVLVKVHATTVTRSDCAYRRAHPFFARLLTGLFRPKEHILGTELAGEIEAVGGRVTRFEVGDAVFGISQLGAHAEFVRVAEDGALAEKPAGMTSEEAAAVCDGMILALTGLRWAKLQPGQRILIYGASGSIGTAGVQLAKYFGAHVTAVCNTPNVDTVRSLGAHEVIDYTREDFTKNGETYDVVFDAVGKHSFARCRNSLERGGTFVETDLGFLWHVPLLALLTKFMGRRRVLLPIPRFRKEDVLLLKDLIEAGKYRAVIDRRYALEQIVEAAEYVETEQKTGNVVLRVDHDSDVPA